MAEHHLSVLSRAPAGAVKQFVEDLIPQLEPISVLENRTGLVMLPATDSAQETPFYLGEVLAAEARVLACGAEGYGACLGRDLEQALALALLDAALTAGTATAQIAAFLAECAQQLVDEDAALARAVGTTRVELETF